MDLQYPHLFSPLRLGDMMLKNRIISSPAGVPKAATPSSTHYGSISAYDRGLGGAGLVIDPIYGCGLEADPFSKYGADSTREILSVMKQSGGLAGYSIGSYGFSMKDGKLRALHPSPGIDCFPQEGVVATREDLKIACSDAAKLAAKTKAFGFDMIMLHIADSSLTSLMLSGWNRRTDEYGGSLENRCRFTVEFVQAIREAVGPGYPVLARIARTLGPVPQTHTEEDSLFLAKQIKPWVDGFIVYNGMDTYGITIENYETNVHQQTTVFEPMEFNLAYSARLKAETGQPVFINCGITGDPSVPEKWIADGLIDGVSMARQLFADPFWPKKAEEGRGDDIVPCLRCNYCYHISTVHDNVQCSVNPRFRRENRVPLQLEKTAAPKRVVVVGGGPAGMKAALIADEKGHHVTLVEQCERLGGMINLADYGVYKKELRNYRDYLVRQIEKSTVQVLLHTVATPQLLKELEPQGLIIAVGGKAAVPAIPGVEHAKQVIDIYPQVHDLTGKIIIIGGGAIGSELGLELGESGQDVTLIEMTDTLAARENWLYRIALRQHVAHCAGLHLMMKTRVVEIRENGVLVKDEHDVERFVEADHVLVATGMQPKREDALSLYGVTPNTTMVGDCRHIGHVLDCTNDAYFVAANI